MGEIEIEEWSGHSGLNEEIFESLSERSLLRKLQVNINRVRARSMQGTLQRSVAMKFKFKFQIWTDRVRRLRLRTFLSLRYCSTSGPNNDPGGIRQYPFRLGSRRIRWMFCRILRPPLTLASALPLSMIPPTLPLYSRSFLPDEDTADALSYPRAPLTPGHLLAICADVP
jgi:hypothetical protein